MPDLIPFKEATHFFEDFEHTAWRLETRRGYASDRNGPNWGLRFPRRAGGADQLVRTG
ncbi:DUF6879 family protein [Streptomyces atratus]|uniref:DUF6879 family protein n=1 Tax=Streptomyces atratus TaxID=1893 RepID=UPI0036890C14